jgi:hypothetical protein
MIHLLTIFGQIALFLLQLFSEGDKEKAQKKKKLAQEIVDAFAETNKDKRNIAIHNVAVKLRQQNH